MLEPEICRGLAEGRVRKAVARARLEERVVGRRRGLEFSLVVEVLAKGEGGGEVDGKVGEVGKEKQEAEVCFRQVFTILQFMKHSYPVEVEPEETEKKAEDKPVLLDQSLEVGEKEPSVWAALCKDYNPIHTSARAARWLGLPGKIAHGNHVAAKAMTLLNVGLEPLPMEQRTEKSWMEVYFRRPVQVPMTLKVDVVPKGSGEDGVTRFRVWREGKVYVEGKVGQLR